MIIFMNVAFFLLWVSVSITLYDSDKFVAGMFMGLAVTTLVDSIFDQVQKRLGL